MSSFKAFKATFFSFVAGKFRPLNQFFLFLTWQNTKNKTAVKLTAVSCAPVVEVKIKRPDTKYQLGFSVQNGVVSAFDLIQDKGNNKTRLKGLSV